MARAGDVDSQAKGKRGELEFVRFCRDHGLEAMRTQQYCGTAGTADVELAAYPWLHIEIKRTERFQLYKALSQAECDAGLDRIPIVFHRRSRDRWIMVCDGAIGLDFMRAWEPFEEGKL